MAKVKKHYRVLARSHINGAIKNPGDVVTIEVDEDTFSHGPNLVELKEPLTHTPAQKAAGDRAAAQRKENLARTTAKEMPKAEPKAEQE